MEREFDDTSLSLDKINEMEERRIAMLNEAGIDEKKVLHDAGEHKNSWGSYFGENITRGKDDVNFTIRDQWTAVERSEFSRLFKPAMTFNKLYDGVKKTVGEQRKNKPDLIVRSLTGKASQEQINLRANLVRTISYQSQNDLVYQTAFRSALTMGYGAFQIRLDYLTPRSFRKVPFYDIIVDPTQTAFDPSALKPHKGDGNFCQRTFILTRDEFFATYPYITNPVSWQDAQMLLDMQYTTKDTIIICDEFVKEWYPLIIYKLSNGMIVTEDQWKNAQETHHYQKKIVAGSIVEKIIEKGIPKVVAERQTQDYRIMHYRMIRDQILDFSEWPSKQLPIVFVDGDSYYIDGRQYTKSFVHEARDAQKCINYFGSEIAAEVKNRRREQWMGTPDNIKGYEQMWRNPELQNGILLAQPDPKTGMMPQKMPAWEISQGLVQNYLRASQDVREIMGITEADQLQGKDISGKARRERKLETSMSTYVFFDNLNQAIEQGGRIVNDLLPYIFNIDEEHDFVITKADGKTENITINERMDDGSIRNSIEEGDFDVEIDTGPSFAVQKEVALEFLAQTLQAAPQTFPLIADLWAKNLDVQFMPQISERFKSIVPPEILAKEEGKEPPPKQPNPQEMLLQAELQNRQQEIVERAHELQLRAQKHELEKAELMLKAQKLQDDMQRDHRKNAIEMRKSELNFTEGVAKIVADIEKSARHTEK